jgi:hypothetical protein
VVGQKKPPEGGFLSRYDANGLVWCSKLEIVLEKLQFATAAGAFVLLALA